MHDTIRNLGILTAGLIATIAQGGEIAEYRTGDWQFNDRGNHRAVVTVDEAADAVLADIPWRRRDDHPEEKAIVIRYAPTDQAVERFFVVENSRESGRIVFDASAGAGEYHVYYLPYAEPTHWAGDPGTYFTPGPAADPAWTERNRLNPERLPRARMAAIESKRAFDSMYPMEVPMTAQELDGFLAKHRSEEYLVFCEDRSRPIRMQDELPYIWLDRDPAAGFAGVARPGEVYALQLGVYAKEKGLENITLAFSDLIGASGRIGREAIECLNLSGISPLGEPFTKRVDVAQGRVQPLWILVTVPRELQGEFSGGIVVSADNAAPREIPVRLRVEGDNLEFGGAGDIASMARLGWLNSSIGLDDTVLPGFEPVTREGRVIRILDREISFGGSGLPDSIVSRGIEVLARPVSFEVTAGGRAQQFSDAGDWSFVEEPHQIAFTAQSRSELFDLQSSVRVEFDGAVFFVLELQARRQADIGDIRLNIPLRPEAAPYLMGMGQRGGRAPEMLSWRWGDAGNSLLWQGGVHAGVQLKLERDDEVWGDSGEMTGTSAAPPVSWDNRGRGVCTVERGENVVETRVSTGARVMQAGETLRFKFRLLVTPFKRIGSDFWNYRWQSQWGGSGDADFNMALLFHGDATCGNSFINYPFLELDQMKRWIDAAQTRAPQILYPAEDNIDLREGAMEVVFHPGIVPAHHGPGSPFYPLAAVRFPGGDELNLFWNSTIQGFTARIRDGYQGVRPQFPAQIDVPCLDRRQDEVLDIRLSWRDGVLEMRLNDLPVGSGPYTLEGHDVGNAGISVWQNPQFPVHSIAIYDRAEGGGLLFADDFTALDQERSLPQAAAAGTVGKVFGRFIAPAGRENPAPRMEALADPGKCLPVLYYTVRELSNHAAELWALRSLGEEIFSSSAVVTAPDSIVTSASGGGYPWLREHLKDGYAPAWRMPMGTFNDAAIGTQGLSRWHNYYLEGMNYLMRERDIRGLYLDGIGYNRDIMRRMAKMMKANDPGSLINIHSGNNYDFFGWRLSPMNVYMEHLPFLDSLWIGELYSYDRDPDYWLVEISGIPFGVTSEMLNYESGGNPYRGMVYGMTGRIHPSASAMWRFWDDFGIQEAQWIGYWEKDFPLKADRGDVRASIYRKDKESLIALGHWPEGGLGRAWEPARLEGAPGEEDWQRIPAAGSFFQVGSEDTLADDAEQTELQVAYDRERLYFRFTCRYPGELKAEVTGRDGSVWTDDSVDVVLKPDRDTVIHLIANARGAIWDNRNGDLSWNGGWEYTTSLQDQAWRGTLAIKWEELLREGDFPEILRFNLFRTVYAPQPKYSAWSPAATYADNASLGKLFPAGTMPQEGLFSPSDEVAVALTIDYQALGLDPEKVEFEMPGINYFQKSRPVESAADIRFPAGKGALIIVRERP